MCKKTFILVLYKSIYLMSLSLTRLTAGFPKKSLLGKAASVDGLRPETAMTTWPEAETW
jgi:hypothetical protein